MAGDWDQIPEPLGVLFGAQLGWSPERESQPLNTTCRTCGGQIPDRSRLYCAACTRTGFEDRCSSARLRDRLARKTRPKEVARFRPRIRLSQREVRAIARTPEGRAWLTELGRLEDGDAGDGK